MSLEVPLLQLLLPELPVQLPLLWAPQPFHSQGGQGPALAAAAKCTELLKSLRWLLLP